MASLAELYGQAATSYGKARAKARQIPANLRESGKGLASWAVDPYGEAQRVMGEYRNMTPEQRQGLVDAAVDLFGGVDVGPVGAIKASHGGPHLFDRFDFSKIGTGEGAQAYGHGGYFAQGFDSPVAKSYKGAGSTAPDPSKDIVGWSRWMMGTGIDESNIASLLKNGGKTNDEIAQIINDANKDVGNLYNVELRWPDAAREAADPLGEHHLLDWDAPLSEQPHMMKFINEEEAKTTKKALDRRMETLASIGESHPNAANVKRQIELLKEEMESPSESGVKRLTGGEYFNYLRRRSIDPKAQAEMFLQQGIPGIRYLDQASRDQGEGTRNYVMFDDRFPNIVTRNGVSITDLLKNR